MILVQRCALHQITQYKGGPDAHDQIVCSFLVEVQKTLATYVMCMCNSNLEIRIAGSSCPL